MRPWRWTKGYCHVLESTELVTESAYPEHNSDDDYSEQERHNEKAPIAILGVSLIPLRQAGFVHTASSEDHRRGSDQAQWESPALRSHTPDQIKSHILVVNYKKKPRILELL